MQYIRHGRSSLRISRLTLGAMGIGSNQWRGWVLEDAASRDIMARAIDLGINVIDTCDFYSAGASEEIIGRYLRETGQRDKIVIATKLGNPMGPSPNDRGYSRRHVVAAVEASLRRLQTDRIDIYQTHIWDPSTNIEEMVEAFDLLVRQGKVLYVGATDIPCFQLAKAVYYARQRGYAEFSSLQHHFNAIWREDERELVPFCRQEGMGLLPYSPLGRGYLASSAYRIDRTTERAKTDDYTWKLYGREQDGDVATAIEKAARDTGATSAQIALAWVLQRMPEASPIFGAENVGHVEEAVSAIELALPPEVMSSIDRAYSPRPTGGHF